MTLKVAKIAGGNVVGYGDFPHQVSLRVPAKQNVHFCGASVIHPLLLLTAAHCVHNSYKPGEIQAVTGDHNQVVAEGTEQIRNVRKFILHPGWNNETLDNDIALLVLERPLEFVNYTSPITLRGPDWELPREYHRVQLNVKSKAKPS